MRRFGRPGWTITTPSAGQNLYADIILRARHDALAFDCEQDVLTNDAAFCTGHGWWPLPLSFVFVAALSN